MTDWIPWTGEYEKIFYDVRTIDGSIYEECWPNAGRFHAKAGKIVHGKSVKEIKISDSKFND